MPLNETTDAILSIPVTFVFAKDSSKRNVMHVTCIPYSRWKVLAQINDSIIYQGWEASWLSFDSFQELDRIFEYMLRFFIFSCRLRSFVCVGIFTFRSILRSFEVVQRVTNQFVVKVMCMIWRSVCRYSGWSGNGAEKCARILAEFWIVYIGT